MSEIIVKVQKITDIKPHPSADRLEIACVGAWTTCVKKNVFTVGDLIVFIPPDAILPESLHEYLGITQYCGEMPKSSEEAQQGKRRVRATRLRGVKSFGTLMTLSDVELYMRSIGSTGFSAYNLVEDDDVAHLLGITKYEPPEKVVSGDMMADNAMFPKYTSIERYQNYPGVFCEDDDVVITEKIHGTNCRVGLVMTDEGLTWMAGSHRTRRKKTAADGRQSLYWTPLDDHNVVDMIEFLQEHTYVNQEAASVIVYGEIYGPGIQDMHYGGRVEFRVFDIMVNGEYVDTSFMLDICSSYSVPTVPVLYIGKFSEAILMEHTDGKTDVCEHATTKFKGREGCVVKSWFERTSDALPNCGRAILKSVSADYLDRRGAIDNA